MMVRLLSGGAANGLVSRMAARFLADTGHEIDGDYGAVGGMRDRVVGGEPVDLVILTRGIVDDLARRGLVNPETVTDLGNVETGVAVLEGADLPDVSTPEALARALGAAAALYVPDTRQATAGVHVARVVAALGFGSRPAGWIREFPNGQTAMAEMVRAGDRAALGSTQLTEILNTPGVRYAGPLPAPHALSTAYTGAVAVAAQQPEAARRLIALLSSPEAAEMRQAAGFSR